MIKERNHLFDNMKALLIFLVVLGHVLSKFGTTQEAFVLYKIIFSFHMPAFLFVSGFFAKIDPKRVLAKLFPLYIVFQSLQYLEIYLISLFTGHPKIPHVQFLKPEWTLWYLMALMVFQLLLPVFDTDRLKKQIVFLCTALLLGLAAGLTPDTDNFMAMSRVFVFLFFFLLGYYEKKSGLLRAFLRQDHPSLSKAVAAAAGFLLVLFLCTYGRTIPARSLFGTESYSDIYTVQGRILAWILAFLWILVLLTWIPDKRLALIGTAGRNTLPIYLFHSLTLLILVRTPLPGIINGNMAGILILAVVITAGLSWSGFDRMLRCIKIPVK